MRLVLLTLLLSSVSLANIYGRRPQHPSYRKRLHDQRLEWPGGLEVEEPEYGELAQEYERDLFQEAAAAERFRRQDPSQPACVQGDVIFILDSSGSIGIENWQFVRQFVSDSVSRMTIGPYGTHVGCVTFGNRSEMND